MPISVLITGSLISAGILTGLLLVLIWYQRDRE